MEQKLQRCVMGDEWYEDGVGRKTRLVQFYIVGGKWNYEIKHCSFLVYKQYGRLWSIRLKLVHYSNIF